MRTNKIASKVMKLAHSIKAQFATFALALKAAWAALKAASTTKIINTKTALTVEDVVAVVGSGFKVEDSEKDVLVYVANRSQGECVLSVLKDGGFSAVAGGKNGVMFARVAKTSVVRKIDVSGMTEYNGKDVEDFFYSIKEIVEKGGIQDADTENWFFKDVGFDTSYELKNLQVLKSNQQKQEKCHENF